MIGFCEEYQGKHVEVEVSQENRMWWVQEKGAAGQTRRQAATLK